MVCKNLHGEGGSKEVLLPFFKAADYGEQLPIKDVIVLFGRGEYLEKIPHSCMFPLVLSCISTAPDAVSKASIIRVKSLEVLEKARTGCLVNVVCRFWKVFFWSGPQVQGVDCLVRSRREQAMLEKEGINFL